MHINDFILFKLSFLQSKIKMMINLVLKLIISNGHSTNRAQFMARLVVIIWR